MRSSKRDFFESLIYKNKIYIGIIAVLLIIICIYEPKFIIPSIILLCIILFAYYYTNKKNKNEVSKHLQELNKDVDHVAKSTLLHCPYPLVVMDASGKPIWKSDRFKTEFINTDIKNYLSELTKDIKIEIENDKMEKKEKNIQRVATIGKKEYKILAEYIKTNKQSKKKDSLEYNVLIYFQDITNEVKLERKYEDLKPCIGIIMIDNYEEVMGRIDTETRPAIIAKVEKAIYDWASLTNGVIVKSERDTFIYFFEQRYLNQIEESKFHILDEVKEIAIEGKLQLTLSIAITSEGSTNYEKYKSALAGIDIVLGRGGDQAVIRSSGKYTFFGGRTQELEKRTKVKARIVAHALEELIKEAKNVIIMGHANGDIDSIGSSLGIYRLATSIGKEAFVVNSEMGVTLEVFLENLKKEKEYEDVIISKNEAISKMDPETLLIVVDTNRRSYVEIPELLERTNKIVVIDHHRRGTDYIDNSLLTFHEVYASSAAELVTELLQYVDTKIELTQIETESLYAGIMVDTKNFTFKTGVRTFEAAAYLRKFGVDIIKVKKWFQSDLNNYNIIADIVKNTEIVNDTIGISTYDKNNKNVNLLCAKAADELLTISDITASFVIGNMGDKVCISGRSIGDINVQLILEKLGGGGHITLAGAQVEGMTVEEVKQELIIRINEYFVEIAN